MSVRKTISFSESTSQALDDLVPKDKRSEFIERAVGEALQQVAKERALDALESCNKMQATGLSVVEALRKVRQEESDRLVTQS